jgi:hypothetical protein
MCNACDTIRLTIARSRVLSVDLTDPSSLGLAKADIQVLEQKLAMSVAEHWRTFK